MSRISSTARRYAGPSYTSHYSSYGSSLTPGLSSYSERDRLSSYKSPTSSTTSSSGYSSSNYLNSSATRSRNYSTSSEPDCDRGRTIPCTDILGSSSSRRSESLSRTPVKNYRGSGLSGGSTYTGYTSYSSPSAQVSYLSSSPVASSISLNRRKSVSQSNLSRDLASLALNDASSSSSSTPSSSTSALRSYRSRTNDMADSYGTSSRTGYSGLSRSSTQEALSRNSNQEAFSSRAFSPSTWEPSSNGLSDSPRRDSTNSKSAQGLVGLKNLGNTCFMNSILQCLSNTHSLRDYCLHNSHRRDLNNNSRTNTVLMEEFAKLIQTMWTSSTSEAVSPSEFKTQIQRYAPRFVGYNQQDAQEFLRFLLDGLHNEVNRVTIRPRATIEDFDHLPDEEKGKKMWSKYLEREDSKIVDLFVGQLKSSLTCSHCGFCSTVFDPFWDLSLPIAKKSYGDISLMDCMRLFTKEDILDGDEKPTCYRCKARRRCTKKFTIQKFPKILVLHLKRFSEARRTSKLSTFVNFPMKDLDLREFASEISINAVYNLYAVSNHSGTTMGGHYTAYCRNPNSGEWYTFNDSSFGWTAAGPDICSQLRPSQQMGQVISLSQHSPKPKPRPNVTIKAEMVEQGRNEFWVVSCISSGGRPDTDISLTLNTNEELQMENSTYLDLQTRSIRLPASLYEGHNVTCVFDHPKFTHRMSRVITLPSFYLSGVRLLDSEPGINSDDVPDTESLVLQEGQSDTVIGLQVIGNVPRYNVTCKKDGGPLPWGVELVGSSLTVLGPVDHHHAGLYECAFSYHHLKVLLHINITVKPQVHQPVPPTIRVDLWSEDRHRVIECSAADAVPAANMTWLLPEGVSGVSWFNFTSHNGSHSVRGVLLLPVCLPWELTAECVINHPAFDKPENRSITFPLCARPNITINSSTEWKNGERYTAVACSVNSVAPAAAISWHVGNSDDIISHLTETVVQADGLISAHGSVKFLSSLYAGQNLTCMVEHPSLKVPEKRTIHIPAHKAPLLSVSVMRQQNSHLWLAVCDCRGEGAGINLAWVLPDNAKGQTSLQSEYEGHTLKSRLTYEFPLALHEGQDLTCVYNFEQRLMERRSVHIPRYYISAVRVLNHTTPLQSRYSGKPIIHRLSLQENHHKQKILLNVEGNVPQYDLSCKRSDGSLVSMEGLAIIFQSELTEQDEGLYTCQASFYHHRARVDIQVEIMSQDKYFALVVISCISSTSAIMFILVVTLWVCCKRNSRTQHKKQESLSALTTLMQDPSSPEVKKESKDYAHLVSYSIVFDVKSTV